MKTARPIPPEVLATPGLRERLMSRIVIRDAGYDTPCWESTYTVHRSGYTRMTIKGKLWRVHRVAYALWVGPIAPGLVLDHLCRNLVCCNPEHLEAVTQGENTARGNSLMARRVASTHCIRGHEFTPENTVRYEGTGRQCRACWSVRYREKLAVEGRSSRRRRTGNETHCANGHERTEENTHVNSRGALTCRTCNREAVRRYKERQAA